MGDKRITATTSTKTRANKIARAAKPSRISADASDLVARIAARAYERYAGRGFEHGHDVEDWLAAEAELREGAVRA
jgi:hypothetical protein